MVGEFYEWLISELNPVGQLLSLGLGNIDTIAIQPKNFNGKPRKKRFYLF